MNPQELRSVMALAGVFGLRMLGLFLILPVFALYADTLKGNTALLTGLAIGAYGLTQAIFQIPFGLLSDKLGRKPVIAAGLLIFAVGSVVAALSDTITGVIVGRALQGMGAIAAAVIALVSDLTREEQRTKAMAMIGMTIGFSFFVALMLGPLLDRSIGVPGIFWLTAVLAMAAIGIVYLVVPDPVSSHAQITRDPLKKQFSGILKDHHLLRLDWGIFSLHLVLTALFVAMPITLVTELGIDRHTHWQVYLPVILLSVVGMLPMVFLTTRKKFIPRIFIVGIVLMLTSELLLLTGSQGSIPIFIFGMLLWFTGFNVLEALMPSLVSRLAPVTNKGAAIGVYNSAEFFGAFLGGVLGGLIMGIYGGQGVYLMSAVVLLVWLVIMLPAKPPKLLDTEVIRLSTQMTADIDNIVQKLGNVAGVAEAIVVADQDVIYLKVDREVLDRDALAQYARQSRDEV
ncbi:MAG TPA: MFS transporter [Gammaproteobacteria bacterium]|nr:MFS transporter [Gammaproteobacteria bacterium]